jgi:mannose-6-phosphate isomerase
MLLTDLCTHHAAELLGAAADKVREFPWLVKLLDCRDRLSIQVHPDDDGARRLSAETSGKTEAWVVLDVQESGWLYAGLRLGVDRAALEKHLQEGTAAECLHFFKPAVGDCLFLPAGTVHAIVGDITLAEVQRSSDVTFRLFDWNRRDSQGTPRPLHIREALESIDWNAGPVSPVRPEPMPGLPAGVQGETLVRCPYFLLQRFRVNAPLGLLGGELTAWLVLEGAARLQGPASYVRSFDRGATVLTPASAQGLTWQPQPEGAVLLAASLPL